MRPTLLIDASSLLYRAFFALPDSIRSPEGAAVNAVHGFLDMIARLIEDWVPDRMACAFDEDWRPQWRVDLLPEYKAHRVAEAEAVEDSGEGPEAQIPMLLQMLEGAGIACVGAPDFEAEDVIGTLAATETAAGRPVGIVSGDRDLFALVRDPDVFVLYPRKGTRDVQVVDEAYIAEKYQIPGRAYYDFEVLRGDPSDGLPGVAGVGEKTASALIRTHGSLDAILAAATSDAPGALGKVARHRDYVEAARRVVRIREDVPLKAASLDLPRDVSRSALRALASANGVGGPVTRLIESLDTPN